MTITTTEKKMTAREFYNAVLALDSLPAELATYATEQIEKLDKTNAQRKGKPSKEALANEPIKTDILNFLVERKGEKFVQAEIGEVLSISPNKAGALARQLVSDGVIKSERVKIPKVGERSVYFAE